MKNWPLILSKMIFDLLRNLFSWAENKTRKRRAHFEPSPFDFEEDEDFYSVPTKRHCCDHIMRNGHEVIEIEDDDDDDDIIEIRERNGNNATYKPARKVPLNISRHTYLRHKNETAASKNHLFNQARQLSASKFIKRHYKNSSQNGKSRNAALSESYRLQDKEKYGQLLQDFLPQTVQISKQKEPRRSQPQHIEVVDVENEQSSIKTPEIFSTPKYTSPVSQSRRISTPGSSRYSTPVNSSIWFTPKQQDRQKSIEEIKLDSDESSAESSHSVSTKTKSVPPKISITPSTPREIVATNTLRDKLSAHDVIKKDYVSRINNTYNERTEQRHKEAEEMKRMANILSKQNRLTREIGLEQQLQQSMKIAEEILVEDDYDEEPSLPELTDEMLDQVARALNPNPPNQVLVESFGLRITRKDIHTLAGLNWLNDEVINFYMNLLIARGGTDKFPPVHAMNTFFYPKLLSGGHVSLKRWTRKIDIFAKDIVVVPIHLGVHWCMSIIDFREKSIRYYDSMGGENPKCLYALKRYIEDESLDKKKQKYDTSDWILESMKDIPQQMNGSDCGVFSCTFAEFICANRKLNFSQDNMPYFRNKMVYEILNVRLL